MAREIKFRVWYKPEGKMYRVTALYLAGQVPYVEWRPLAARPLDEHELMQFTGLKDNKGKEMYESDIVHVEFPEYTGKEPDTGWVIWDNTEGSWRIQSYAWWCYPYQGDLEVIGNIYEQPDLVAKEDI